MKLTVYTSKKCPKCAALKKWLKRHKVSFKERSIDDTDIMTELVMRNIVVLSAPAIETSNRFFLSHQISDFIKKFLRNNKEKPQWQ